MEGVEVAEAKKAEIPVQEGQSEGYPVLDWAVVSSVPEKEFPKDRIQKFYAWLTLELTTCAATAYTVPETLNFASEAKDVVLVKAGVEDELREAYKSIRNTHPSVVVLFQILPGASCDEYEWMKKYTWEYGLARQGIQKGNVLNRFDGVPESDRPGIFKSMVDWLLRRIAQLAYGPVAHRGIKLQVTGEWYRKDEEEEKMEKEERKVQVVTQGATQMREGDEDIAPPITRPPPSFNPYEVERLLHRVMHRGTPVTERGLEEEMLGHSLSGHGPVFTKEIAIPQGVGYGSTSPETLEEFSKETDILIKGIPNTFTQFEVASIFSEFRVKMVRLGLEAESAFLRLGSKFEVMEAVLRRNETWIRERYRIRVCACNPTIQAEIQSPLTAPPSRSRHSPGLGGGASHHSSPLQTIYKRKTTKTNQRERGITNTTDQVTGSDSQEPHKDSTDSKSIEEGSDRGAADQPSPSERGDEKKRGKAGGTIQKTKEGKPKKTTTNKELQQPTNEMPPIPAGRKQLVQYDDDLFS